MNNKINIFCLPFAGGSRYSYNGYRQYAQHINIVPLELPGRGSRFQEPLLDNIHDMVEDLFAQIKERLSHPYAIYGHSMGALLGFLLTRRIVEEGLREPRHLFFTGRAAPCVKKVREAIHTQPRDEFFASLKELGGCPEELLQDEALMDCFEPIIRADFQALANYQYETGDAFDIPITVMTGVEEDISREEALAWQQETTALVAVKAFVGDHFFIYGHERAIVNIMTGVMLQQQQKALRRPAAETLLMESENERLW